MLSRIYRVDRPRAPDRAMLYEKSPVAGDPASGAPVGADGDEAASGADASGNDAAAGEVTTGGDR